MAIQILNRTLNASFVANATKQGFDVVVGLAERTPTALSHVGRSMSPGSILSESIMPAPAYPGGPARLGRVDLPGQSVRPVSWHQPTDGRGQPCRSTLAAKQRGRDYPSHALDADRLADRDTCSTLEAMTGK